MMLRRVGNVLVLVWMVIVKICHAILGKRKQETTKEPFQSAGDKGWKTEWEEWEMTDVKVESTNNEEESEPQVATPDLFKDMAPVIHTAKKIHLKGSSQKLTPNLNQFAVDPSFTATSSELLEWSDEEAPEGWGDDDERDLPELLRQSRRQTAGRKKRDPTERQTNNVTAVGLGATRIVD